MHGPSLNRAVNRERWLAVGFASARLAFCSYRAATQSLVHDEAFTFHKYVSGPWSTVHAPYDVNNHVLHTILAKLSIHLLGVSEVTLRLPSLLSGFFLILGIFWILQPVTSRLVRWVAILAIGLHPLLLDFSVAARGYSLSLALLAWAIWFMMQRRPLVVGALLGLSVSANMTTAFPALGLIFAAVVLEDGSLAERLKLVFETGITAAALFGLICYQSLLTAHHGNFVGGAATVYESVSSLVSTSLLHNTERPGLFGPVAATVITNWFLPLLAGLVLLSLRGALTWNLADLHRMLLPLMFVTTFIGVIGASHFLQLPYPADRTGLYLVLLFGMSWAISASLEKNAALRGIHLLLASVLAIQFATQLESRYFLIWKYDMDTAKVARMLEHEFKGKPPASATACVLWVYQPALEFYRQYLQISALKPVDRTAPTPLSGCSVYMLSYPEQKTIAQAGLHEVFFDPIGGAFLAIGP